MFDFLQSKPLDTGSWLDEQRANNPDLTASVNFPQTLANTQMPGGQFNVDSFNAMNKANGTFGGYGTTMGSPGSGGSMFGGFLGGVDPKTGMKTQGWGNFGLSALQAGAGLYLGNKQLGLAEDQFAEAKRQFGRNFDMSEEQYYTQLKDRQDRRYIGAGGDNVAGNPYQKTDQYMKENKVNY